ADLLLRGELEDRPRPDGGIRDEDSVLVDYVGDRDGEHPVVAGRVPVALQGDRERERVLLRLCAVRGDVAAADGDDLEVVALALDPLELRRQRLARRAVRVDEDEQEAAPPVVLERHGSALERRQRERWRRRP